MRHTFWRPQAHPRRCQHGRGVPASSAQDARQAGERPRQEDLWPATGSRAAQRRSPGGGLVRLLARRRSSGFGSWLVHADADGGGGNRTRATFTSLAPRPRRWRMEPFRKPRLLGTILMEAAGSSGARSRHSETTLLPFRDPSPAPRRVFTVCAGAADVPSSCSAQSASTRRRGKCSARPYGDLGHRRTSVAQHPCRTPDRRRSARISGDRQNRKQPAKQVKCGGCRIRWAREAVVRIPARS
jgi:hypothetical protein